MQLAERRPDPIVLDADGALADVVAALAEGELSVRVVSDIEQLDRDSAQIIVVDLPHLPRVRERGWLTLAICREATLASLIEAREQADEVLPWPEGRGRLVPLLAELKQRAEERQMVGTCRRTADLLGRVGLGCRQAEDFDDFLNDVLETLVETVEARRALVLAWHREGELVYIMGTSDDPTASMLPTPAASFPEIGRLTSDGSPLWLTGVDVAARVGSYRQITVPVEQSLLLCPLVYDALIYGMVELHFDDAEPRSSGVLQMARQFAALLAPQVVHSDLYRETREQTRRISLAEIGWRPGVWQKYEDFFKRSFDGIVVLDREGAVVYLNPAGEQITGYSRSGVANQPFEQMVAESDRPLLRNILAEVRGKGAGHNFDLELTTTSGDPIVVSVSTGAVLDEEEGLVLSFRDVTESRVLSDELRATKEFLERLIDSTVDGIIATDLDGRVVLFNQGAERIFGLREEEVVGRMSLDDLFPPGVAAKVMEQLRGPGDGGVGRLETTRKEIVSRDRELIPVNISASIIYEDGVEVGTVGILSDLRDRLRMERRLVQAQEKLMETEKQALIAEVAGTTAHELNQPLTSVMGYAELLKKRLADDDANQRAVDVILRESQRIAEIVRKIGKITRYETKTYVGDTQILDLEKSSE